MIEYIKIIISNVLTALYQPFWYAMIMAMLCMFVYMFAQELGLKVLIKRWIDNFKSDKQFRRIFLFAFYTIMILFKTLLNREMWANPISNVIGVWGMRDANGNMTTEIFENLALFIPFSILLLWCFRKKILGERIGFLFIILQAVKIAFLFSLSIEFLQLFLRLGTFQLSDLFYNTLGGLVGGIIYGIGYKLLHKPQ